MSSAGHSLPKPRLTKGAAGLVAIVLVLAAAAIFPLRQFAAQRGDLAELERKVEVLESERNDLARKVERLQDPEYLERIARQCLGMVRPGEIAFVAVPEDGSPMPASC